MSHDMQLEDRRWGVRLSVDTPVSLRADQGLETSAWILNASVSGAFLSTRERPALHSRVAVCPPGIPVSWMEALVTRLDSDGLALEWLEPGSRPAIDLLALGRNNQVTQVDEADRSAQGVVTWNGARSLRASTRG